MRKQLIAKNSLTGMTIIQRFIDGDRFYKFLPKTIRGIAIQGIRKQFEGKPIEIIEGETGWIKIKKLDSDEKLEESSEKLLNKMDKKTEDVDAKFILDKEAEMLRKQGFVVTLEDLD